MIGSLPKLTAIIMVLLLAGITFIGVIIFPNTSGVNIDTYSHLFPESTHQDLGVNSPL